MKKITVKLKDGNKRFFRFSGVASSESRDSDGEMIKQHGINLSLVKQGKAIVNAEHDDVTIGHIENAELINGQLYIEGIVFIKTIKAKRFYDLLAKDDPRFPVTLSIEFVNPEYSPKDKSVLTGIILTGVALVGLGAEPANKDTYAELMKSIPINLVIEELIRRANSSAEFRKRLLKILEYV